jgi:hypothetical protein
MGLRRQKEGRVLCVFRIKPRIAGQAGVVFARTNALSSAPGLFGEDVRGLELIDFGGMRLDRRTHYPQWSQAAQAEVLVPQEVPLEAVDEVLFPSRSVMDGGIELWGEWPAPPFYVHRASFS